MFNIDLTFKFKIAELKHESRSKYSLAGFIGVYSTIYGLMLEIMFVIKLYIACIVIGKVVSNIDGRS